MSWLVTGGCGFVGANLADALLAQGVEVVILDNLSRTGSRENLNWLRSRHGRDFPFIKADVRNPRALHQAVRNAKPAALAHLAGQVAMTRSIEDPRLDFEVNALGTLNVLEAVRLQSPSTIVLYSSTNKVYGSLDTLACKEEETRYVLPDYPNGLNEDFPLDGHTPYGCSKLAADQYVRDYHRVYGLPTVVFRHSSMYGGRQYATYDQGWIGWFCLKCLESARSDTPPFSIAGNGKQVRDVLHAEDVVRAYLDAVARIGRTAGEVFNIGGGIRNSLSLLELFSLLEQFTGGKAHFRCLPPRPGDQKVFVADSSKANERLGWRPLVDKLDGIRRMLMWSEDLLKTRSIED